MRYRGYYYDAETGFYYLQSRYYDPALGRFINADSYASTGTGFLGYNMLAYCGNGPVSATDYNGHLYTDGYRYTTDGVAVMGCAACGAIGGGVGGVLEAVNDGYSPKDGWDFWWYVITRGSMGFNSALFWGSSYYTELLYGSEYSTPSLERYNSWQEAEHATRDIIHSVSERKSRTFDTPYGTRIEDAYNPSTGVIAESKYGRQGCSSFILSEMERDIWLRDSGAVARVEWHFYYSVNSNTCGPTGPLYMALDNADIVVVIHP